ncbi:putative ABC transport system permease protein [Propionicimonas paludicola]|uniref:Putative ABC transport system permease protein n=1 Tax=Propionicimonas paludicola TaxID=185243 RepID=A0A2A9CPE4_9ACTN|nr:FtsX-like permease family protein [Propionicimonas paludicola]PFG15530.1 putative ABC transport system permease protein [Propionicimonas paludicola]
MSRPAPSQRSDKAGRLPLGNLWRQSRRDLGPLLVGLIVIAAASFLASAVPQVLSSVATAVVQDAVAHPSRPPEILVQIPFDSSDVPSSDGSDWFSTRIEAGMPTELRGVLAAPVLSMVGPELKAGSIAGRPGRARFIYVHSAGGPAVTWVEGRAPAATGDVSRWNYSDEALPIEVALSVDAAALIGVHPGQQLTVTSTQGAPLDVRLSGIYRPDDLNDDAWKVTPTLVKPQLVDGSAAVASVGLLVSPESLPFAMIGALPGSMDRTYTYPVIASRLDAGRAEALAVEARSLAAGRKSIDLNGSQPRIHTNLDAIIDDALARVAAASAQASVLLIGLLATALLVELLVAGLLVERRSAVLVQWRARGATLPVIAWANLLEAALLTILGGGIGVGAAMLLLGGTPPPAWLVPTLLAALLPQPLLAVRAAGGGVRAGAVAVGKHHRLATAHARRLAAEIMLGVVALAALATLVMRGVVASSASIWTDGVVLAAPVLVAVAVALLLIRLQPSGLALARRLATRRTAAVPLLAAARVRADGLATAALVVSCAMAAIATTVAVTVSSGQIDASWDAVGGEAAVTSTSPDGIPSAVLDLDGDAGLVVATAAVVPSAQLLGSGLDRSVSVVAIDADAFGRLLAATSGSSDALKQLTTANPSAVPVLSTGLPQWDSATLLWGDDRLSVQAVGIAPTLPSGLGLSDYPTVVADRRLLAAALGHEVAASQAWVVGPDAAARLRAAVAGTDAQLLTRQEWLAAQAHDPLRNALGWLFAGASAAAVALAALAVMLMAAAGAGQRTRAAAQLRVIGMPAAAARRVSWLEVAVPAVLTGLVGLAIGIGLSGLLVTALDLKSVTGGRVAPRLVIFWWALALPILLGVLARLAVLIAGLRGRRVPLGPLMRAS